MLASSWQVAVFVPSGLDFLPFQSHPNAHLIFLHDADMRAQLYEVISSVFNRYAELVLLSGDLLGSLELDGPSPGRLLAIVDEFANLADALTDREWQELWRHGTHDRR